MGEHEVVAAGVGVYSGVEAWRERALRVPDTISGF
jgi:hypothetical protein